MINYSQSKSVEQLDYLSCLSIMLPKLILPSHWGNYYARVIDMTSSHMIIMCNGLHIHVHVLQILAIAVFAYTYMQVICLLW